MHETKAFTRALNSLILESGRTVIQLAECSDIPECDWYRHINGVRCKPELPKVMDMARGIAGKPYADERDPEVRKNFLKLTLALTKDAAVVRAQKRARLEEKQSRPRQRDS